MVPIVACLFACVTSAPSSPVARLIPSTDPPVEGPSDLAHTFVWLEVPENRDSDDTSTIRLPVYRFDARTEDPEPDPVVLLLGGPGLPTSTVAPYLRYYRYLDHRDVILVDQRGTRFCQPALESPEWDAALAQESSLADAARATEQRLRGEGVDLDAYHSLAIAQDLRDLRKLLGLDRWNLVTGSYSTKIAQVLMHIDGAAIRSAVLDSPMPLDRRYDEEHNANLGAAILQALTDCESDPGCRDAFPNLRERVTARLLAEPPGARAALVGQLPLGAPGPFAELPGAMNALAELPPSDATGSPSTGPGSPSEFTMGMRLAVWAAEEAAYAGPTIVAAEATAHPLLGERSPALFDADVVAALNVAPADPLVTRPVHSDIPTLLLVGTLDPLTPPAWADHLARGLENSMVVRFAGWGHSPLYYWDQPLGITLADAFLRNPDAPLPIDVLERASALQFESE